jgi:FkbM family methyltransferase
MTGAASPHPAPHPFRLTGLARQLRYSLALGLLGKSAAARGRLADHLRQDSAYKGPVLVGRQRTLVACGDHHMWVQNGDAGVGRGLLKHGSWQRSEFTAALDLIQARNGRIGPVFLDVGANIGTHTVYAALCGHFSSAIAIEPEPRNLRLLRDNIAANDLAMPVTVVEAAVGRRQGTAHLTLHDSDTGMHSLSAAAGARSIEVRLDTVAAILRNLDVDPKQIGLLWMDVEGQEFEVLAAADELLAHRVPIFFEYSRAAGGDSLAYWTDTFRQAGYCARVVGHRGAGAETDIAEALQIEFGNILLV